MITTVWNIIRGSGFIELEKFITLYPFRNKSLINNKKGPKSFYIINSLT